MGPQLRLLTNPALLLQDNIRKTRTNVQTWIRYAGFEEKQGELARARSVFERALDVEPRNVGIWMRYAEMEMRAKQVGCFLTISMDRQ